MARRILSAESALLTTPQFSLESSVRTESEGGWLNTLDTHYGNSATLSDKQVLFDWGERSGLMREIELINLVQDKLDSAALRVAPSILRVVLTVQANIPRAKDQREFLLAHLNLDFRRISELCIVAESYGLLSPQRRARGEAEIQEYGWSKALKLAAIRNPAHRRELWEQARGAKGMASYRSVLAVIKQYREQKVIEAAPGEIGEEISLDSLANHFDALRGAAAGLSTKGEVLTALRSLEDMQKSAAKLKRMLKNRLQLVEAEQLAHFA